MKEWNVQAAVQTLRHSAGPHAPPFGHHKCAEFTRKAIEAGFGGAPIPHTSSAKDYGPILIDEGFVSLGQIPGGYLAGDVAVIEGLPRKSADGRSSADGHMCMFDGNEWISDFHQGLGADNLYPGPNYKILRPPYVVCRHQPPRVRSDDSSPRDPFARPPRTIP